MDIFYNRRDGGIYTWCLINKVREEHVQIINPISTCHQTIPCLTLPYISMRKHIHSVNLPNTPWQFFSIPPPPRILTLVLFSHNQEYGGNTFICKCELVKSQFSSCSRLCCKLIQIKRSLVTWMITLPLLICPSLYKARPGNLIGPNYFCSGIIAPQRIESRPNFPT